MKVRVKSGPPFPQPFVTGEAEYPPRIGLPFEMVVDQVARRRMRISTGTVAEIGDGFFVTTAGVKYEIQLLDRAQVADLRRRARRRARA